MRGLAGCLCLVAIALAACGRPAPRPLAPVTLSAPGFGDSRPHEWDGRSPASYAVHGIDLSRWQTEVDWRQAQASGVSFAFIKATEGGDVADPRFKEHWNGARRAGIPRGAYHYYYFCRTPEEQARWFIANVPREQGALPPVLDIEWTHTSRNCPRRPDGAQVRAAARKFLTILERHYGQRPVVYTTVDFYRDTGIGDLGGTEFWLRSTAGHPSKVYPGQHWTFWQFTGTGLISGIKGNVDINAFAGSPAAWAAWLTARRQ
ncbi:MAG: GH25 family lysozyme [Gemmobacter sp.]|nr:GH25 family lysozyme [Gemmobacter sp.]